MRTFEVLVAFECAAGCAGTGQVGSPPPLNASVPQVASNDSTSAQVRVEPDAGSKDSLTFQISVPKSSNHSSKGSYVSPGSLGLLLVITGKTNVAKAFGLMPRSPGCSKASRSLDCTISLDLKAGSYTTNLSLYDLAPVHGQIPSGAHLLSTALNVPFSITGGQPTSITLSFRGVPSAIAVGGFPSTCSAFPATPFSVTAADADAYAIAGTYATPLTLTDSDTSGATTIATSGKDMPPLDVLLSSSDVATIAWNGNPIPGGSATIAALAGTVTGSGQFAPTTISPGSAKLYYTGGAQNFSVPACATTVYVVVYAAQGGGPYFSNPGGLGGGSAATIATTPGESLAINLGGAGGVGTFSSAGAGGFDGGGVGAPPFASSYAGGNGGGGYETIGGYGGGPNGASGADGGCAGGLQGKGGGGGTQSSGGAGGAGSNGGSLGFGGAGVGSCGNPSLNIGSGSGGGGGGYYGGGGANGGGGGGGGGGSGFAEASATNVVLNSSVNPGDGFALICWGYTNQRCGPADPLRREK